VWQKIKKQSGYSLEEFLNNYRGRKFVNAIKIGKHVEYRKPRSLQKYYNIARAPQNFMYLPRIKH
jgi:predicted transcriptional regulator